MRRSRWNSSFRVLALAFLTACFALRPALADCGKPAPATGDLPVAAPAELGLDPKSLCALDAMLDKETALNVHGILVLRHGRLAFEKYLARKDTPWGKDPGVYSYDATTLHDLRSISKSVVGLLVGIAIDRGLIKSVEDPIFSYLPAYADRKTPQKEAIKISHLLTMTSGLKADEDVPYNHPVNSERLMAISPDPYAFALERELVFEPGSHWVYDGGSTMILSKILQQVTGKSLPDFAREALFEPLGITEFEWIGLRKSGEPAAYGSLRLRPRDLAKIGQLVLDKGQWQGKQVVSAAWIKEATTARQDGWFPIRYGYHWWVGAEMGAERTKVDWTGGIGIGGQRVFVLPGQDMVVVVTAGMFDEDRQMAVPFDIVTQYLLPAIAP
jgi:CubicO group peptidase (beta-lactamase class C family)